MLAGRAVEACCRRDVAGLTDSCRSAVAQDEAAANYVSPIRADRVAWAGMGGGTCGPRDVAGLTVERFTCAARAHVATAARRTACLHVSRAMQAARRRSGFDFPRRLGRRTEAGPRRVLPRVRPPCVIRYYFSEEKRRSE